MNGLTYVRPGNGFVPNFPITEKVDVNGQRQHPLYAYLKSLCPQTYSQIRQPVLYSPIYTEDVRWNYEKFLVGPDGKPMYRYAHIVDPSSDAQMLSDIKMAVAKLKAGGSADHGILG